MNSFLRMVVSDLYTRSKGNLSRTVVVFPNRRSQLYFDEHLAHVASSPIWAPSYTNISELLESLSSWHQGEHIHLVTSLYQVYQQYCSPAEPLDEFYFWGEMLLNDFNDVDKSLVNAQNLFTNLHEFHRMGDDLSYINSEQRKALENFFGKFGGNKPSEVQKNFARVWNHLFAIYSDYRQLLSSEGIAYEGMLQREVVEHLDLDSLPFSQYVFVGFNVLTRVEHHLFSILQKTDRALFYWDYDKFYVEPQGETHHEAGYFLSENIRNFPSPLSPDLFDSFSLPKEIQFVEASTENSQARYVGQWLSSNLTSPERDTVVALCNEGLLSPVLHSLPEEVSQVNVTMGYPLVHTPAYSFVKSIIEAHTKGYNPSRGNIRPFFRRALQLHPFTLRMPAEEQERLLTPVTDKLPLSQLIQWALEMVALSFRNVSTDETPDPFTPIYKESIFKAYTVVNRFLSLLESRELTTMSTSTFFSLMLQEMGTQRIPFHSEPAVGLQVMGMLETGCLDFRHVLLLSTNEGFMPRLSEDLSFIPFSLRQAFDMPTIEHRVSVSAYYFYRLIQRAERITLVYNSVTDGRQKGEMSRFMKQLQVAGVHQPESFSLSTLQTPASVAPFRLEKTPEVMASLFHRFDYACNPNNVLSPSALNTYMDCSLKFYFRYVATLRPLDEEEEEVDNAMFGTLFHKVAEDIYNDLSREDPLITPSRLEPFLRDKEKIMEYVDRAFASEFFASSSSVSPDYNGLQLINREVICSYIHTLLTIDATDSFVFLQAEEPVRHLWDVHTPERVFQVNLGGIIDRVDRLQDGTLRIIDYKTGGSPKKFHDMADLTDTSSANRANYIFQIFLYATIKRLTLTDETIQPLLLYINRVNAANYHSFIQRSTATRGEVLDVLNFTREDAEEFREALDALLRDHVFNPCEPFIPTSFPEKCRFCDFTSICHPNL